MRTLVEQLEQQVVAEVREDVRDTADVHGPPGSLEEGGGVSLAAHMRGATATPPALATFVDVLSWWGAIDPTRHAFSFLPDGTPDEQIALSYGELDQRARVVAGKLQDSGAPGEPDLASDCPTAHPVAAYLSDSQSDGAASRADAEEADDSVTALLSELDEDAAC